MPRVELSSLPDHGRIWVFPAGRRLEEEEARTLLAEVDEFLDGWAAHGSPLRSARQLRDRQFLVVAVDEDVESPSGCSIDALVHGLKELGRKLEVTLVEHGAVWFRAGGDVRTVSRSEFRRMARDGEVDLQTPVFDTSLTRLSALRAHGLERPAAESWHGRAFFGASEPA